MSIEAMKQALEALKKERENYVLYGDEDGAPEYIHEAIKALEEALAKQEQGEPAGVMTPRRAEMFMTRFKHEEKMLGSNEQAALDYVIAMLVAKQEQGEPVGEIDSTGMAVFWANKPPNGAKLYTTPQQRKPLTDEQIDKAMAENKQTLIDAADNYWKMRRAYARIIEAAHGIKE